MLGDFAHMKPITQLLSFRRHLFGVFFLLPYFAVESIYYVRRLAERSPRLGTNPTSPVYEYHLTPFTAFLGSSLVWIFWGGILGFVVHSVFLRHLGIQWLWVKMLLLPFYFVAAFFWSFHPEW